MDFSLKIAAIIVLYNKNVEDSITCQRIKNIKRQNIAIYIADNSTNCNNNADYCAKKSINYISMKGNKGLSKAYNAAIDKCYGKYDAIILMDDDTEVIPEYFSVLEKALVEHPEVDVFAPIVYGQDGVIYSPNEFDFLRNHFLQSENQTVSNDRFNAIASMLAIRMNVFEEYRFNEKLFIDQVDQYFFCEQRKKHRKFMKLNVIIHQNFYQREMSLTSEAGWNRLQLRVVDIMRHADLMGGGKYYLLGVIKCCGLGVQIGKKCKSISIPIKSFGLCIKSLFGKK